MGFRAGSGTTMDVTTGLIMLMAAAAVGRGRHARDAAPAADAGGRAAREPVRDQHRGDEALPECNTGNLVTDAICSNCGKHLPG